MGSFGDGEERRTPGAMAGEGPALRGRAACGKEGNDRREGARRDERFFLEPRGKPFASLTRRGKGFCFFLSPRRAGNRLICSATRKKGRSDVSNARRREMSLFLWGAGETGTLAFLSRERDVLLLLIAADWSRKTACSAQRHGRRGVSVFPMRGGGRYRLSSELRETRRTVSLVLRRRGKERSGCFQCAAAR